LKANTVRLIQKSFIANGVKVFTGKKKGPKKPRWTTFSEEAAFLEGFVKEAKDASVLVANEIKAAWEKELGRTVHKTTLYRMLKRHGWRKVVPRQKHPKQDKEAVEAFKKGATKKE
jgi:transposase